MNSNIGWTENVEHLTAVTNFPCLSYCNCCRPSKSKGGGGWV